MQRFYNNKLVNYRIIELKKDYILGIEMDYPKIKLSSIKVSNIGYLRCGILDVKILDALHLKKKIIAVKI
jgi:uncharacterized protein YunC (DUF1805 family)